MLLLRFEEGRAQVETSSLVVFAVIFVLGHRYRMPKDRIRALGGTIISMGTLYVENQGIVARALDHFVDRNVPFADAFNVATMEARGITASSSWDTDFDRFPSVTRWEPDTAGDGE